MTHPKLTAAHDFKCPNAAIGTWAGSGWQVRADQSDPPLELAPGDDPPPVPEPPAEHAEPAADPPTDPKPVTTKKGG